MIVGQFSVETINPSFFVGQFHLPTTTGTRDARLLLACLCRLTGGFGMLTELSFSVGGGAMVPMRVVCVRTCEVLRPYNSVVDGWIL